MAATPYVIIVMVVTSTTNILLANSLRFTIVHICCNHILHSHINIIEKNKYTTGDRENPPFSTR